MAMTRCGHAFCRERSGWSKRPCSFQPSGVAAGEAMLAPSITRRLLDKYAGKLPTGEELGAQFERFLADLDEGDRDDKGR